MPEKNIEFELINKFIEGDNTAFNKIANEYKEKIYWHSRRMTGNHLDADEIVQEVLLVIYKKLKDFQFKSSLYTWIYRITTTRCLNYLKKRKIKVMIGLDDNEALMLNSNEDIINNLEDKEQVERIEKILQEVPAKQREVFIFRTYNELSYEEISQITGKSVGGLKANYFHAVQKITELMQRYE